MNKFNWPFSGPMRKPFEDKYSAIASEWNVNPSLVNYIIRRYTKELEKNLSRLSKGEKVTLPRYFADKRTDAEYIYDLIDGWIVEDFICDAWLKDRLEKVERGVKIKHMGTNRDREVHFNGQRKITTKPDFVYQLPSGREVKVELQMARKLRSSYDMKESKVQRAIKDGSVIYLWILLPSDEYFFLSPTIFKHKKPISNPRWGGKKVYSISIDEVKKNKWGPYLMQEDIPLELYGLLGLKEQEKK